ncbi:hypothetical protein XELAEV_18016229mg [Xenopus laevis]|uniref:Helix-turn-helix domain-containing protein n=1 Tax=Xenopus laevis TaxID=8355 RepID=A0A974DJK4_XENLA|nr:hypothetical protein XELAEV_18016229mg [Xenopus laevis]
MRHTKVPSTECEKQTNLSTRTLNRTELDLLEKGLSFCPIKRFDLFDTIVDVNRFVRNILIKKHFYKDNKPDQLPQTTDISPPPKERFSTIDNKALDFKDVCSILTLEDLQHENNMIETKVGVETDNEGCNFRNKPPKGRPMVAGIGSLGLKAMSFHLDQYINYGTSLKDFRLEAIEFLLSHNFFLFDKQYYLQKQGTKMGAKFAPSYANLYMGCLASERNKATTSLYRKECAANTLLRATSSHPKHLIRNIPIDQFLRLRRLCSNSDTFVKEACQLRDRLLQRGYHLSLLIEAFKKALMTRNSLFHKETFRFRKNSKTPLNLDKPLCIFTYSPQYPMIKRIIEKKIPILKTDEKLNNILNSGCKFITRKNLTLSNMRSPSMINTEKESHPLRLMINGNFICGEKRCAVCPYMKKSDTFSDEIKQYINCNTRNLFDYMFEMSKSIRRKNFTQT